MKRAIPIIALMLGALTPAMHAQTKHVLGLPLGSTEFALTYSGERAKVVSTNCCFWMNGGTGSASVNVYRGLGLVASLTGQHSSRISPGLGLDTITWLLGPRYTLPAPRWMEHLGLRHRSSVFGEALLGRVNAFNSAFPRASGVADSENAFAMQVGGGLNLALLRGLGLRAIEMDYVRTSLPNGASNSQNHLRFAFGVTYHLGR